MSPHIKTEPVRIADFCQKWKISELALFGSELREDLRPDSDIDLLISFSPEVSWRLFDWLDMIEDLQTFFGRNVDLICKEGLKNPCRRNSILQTCEVIMNEIDSNFLTH